MTRKSLARRQGEPNGSLQAVWWKPFVTMQKNMTRTFRDSLAGTPLEGAITAQENLFEKLEENVSNVFGEIFNNRQMMTPWLIGDHTEPYIDIIENRSGYKLKAELPGVKEKDISVEFVEGGIEIRGEKYEECAEKGENYRHQECHAGYFSRTIALPDDADLEHAKTRFNLNVLTIDVPKRAEKERKLTIRKKARTATKPKAVKTPKKAPQKTTKRTQKKSAAVKSKTAKSTQRSTAAKSTQRSAAAKSTAARSSTNKTADRATKSNGNREEKPLFNDPAQFTTNVATAQSKQKTEERDLDKVRWPDV